MSTAMLRLNLETAALVLRGKIPAESVDVEQLASVLDRISMHFYLADFSRAHQQRRSTCSTQKDGT